MHVEFLGVSRERAGVAEIDVEAGTLGRLLGTLAVQMPPLRIERKSELDQLAS